MILESLVLLLPIVMSIIRNKFKLVYQGDPQHESSDHVDYTEFISATVSNLQRSGETNDYVMILKDATQGKQTFYQI